MVALYRFGATWPIVFLCFFGGGFFWIHFRGFGTRRFTNKGHPRLLVRTHGPLVDVKGLMTVFPSRSSSQVSSSQGIGCKNSKRGRKKAKNDEDDDVSGKGEKKKAKTGYSTLSHGAPGKFDRASPGPRPAPARPLAPTP